MLSSEPGHGVNPSLPLPTEEQIEQFEAECRERYLRSVNASTHTALPSDFAEQQVANGLGPMEEGHFVTGLCWAILFAVPVWSAALAFGYWLWKK